MTNTPFCIHTEPSCPACCGPCDTGTCHTGNREFRISAAHPHPPWWDYDGEAMFRKFVEAVEAIKKER